MDGGRGWGRGRGRNDFNYTALMCKVYRSSIFYPLMTLISGGRLTGELVANLDRETSNSRARERSLDLWRAGLLPLASPTYRWPNGPCQPGRPEARGIWPGLGTARPVSARAGPARHDYVFFYFFSVFGSYLC